MIASALVAGCSQPTETLPTVGNDSGSATSGTTDDTVDASAEDPPGSDEGASMVTDGSVRFVANKKLEVPGMACPYGCYPSIEKTLAQLPGVEGVQLAKQPEGTPEGVLVTKIVELKVDENFDLEKALAAMKAARFPATEIN